ncbi:hypothetical protein LCGC14_0916000 [marine sediment metagenome]|uniref:Nicotinamide mononucleotide transporter PnuC n=1 Tax=marine sediment metagenome TaxID=412755 RepID=A0A0F9NWZ1_9ZZZZ
MIEIIGVFATILAVTGVLANNRRLRWCFIVWMVSNSLTAGIHAYAGIWSLLVRDVIFLALAVEGWRMWKKKEK